MSVMFTVNCYCLFHFSFFVDVSSSLALAM